MPLMVRFQIVLEPEQLEALRQIQQETDQPVSRQIRSAIDEWLQRQRSGKAERTRPRKRKRSRPRSRD
jgi:hypothetical protein